MASEIDVVDPDIVLDLEAGLTILLQASTFAQDLQRDAWDFATEISTLRAAGLNNNDFRWLLWKGLVEQRCELTAHGDMRRQFHRPIGRHTFDDRTCFVLTQKGLKVAEQIDRSTFDSDLSLYAPHRSECLPLEVAEQSSRGESRPKWDCDRQELRVGRILVKQFKMPSANQQRILMAFEEVDWAPRIDDPLPPCRDIDPKRRLNDAIKRLNRHQKNCLMHFMGDGTGHGARWELLVRQV